MRILRVWLTAFYGAHITAQAVPEREVPAASSHPLPRPGRLPAPQTSEWGGETGHFSAILKSKKSL